MATLRVLEVDGYVSDAQVAALCETYGPVGRVVSIYGTTQPVTRTIYVDMPDDHAATTAARHITDTGIAGRRFVVSCYDVRRAGSIAVGQI